MHYALVAASDSSRLNPGWISQLGLRTETPEAFSWTTEVLVEQARNALEGLRVLIAIDEAHLMNREALRQIRYLYDQSTSRFSLVMTGSDFSDAWAAAPELESRIKRHVEFGPLPGTKLTNALAAYHPVLAATDRDLLLRINRETCAGNWRKWETVLESALGHGATAQSGITEAIANVILGSIPPAEGVGRPRRKR